MRVYMRHLRALKYCSAGVRYFCKKHGIDYSDFLHNGIEAETLLAYDDAMAAEAVREAEREQQ